MVASAYAAVPRQPGRPGDRARLLAIDAPPDVCRSLAEAGGLDFVSVGPDWNPLHLSDPAPSPADVVLLWVSSPAERLLERVSAFHASHPRVPLLARVPPDADGLDLLLLRSGVQELLYDVRELPRAAALARSRVELLAEASRRESSEPARATYDGLFPNLYDWIYVIGVAEDGALSFETVNPPLHAAGGLLNPDFVGRAPEVCLPQAAAGILRTNLERVLSDGVPLLFDEEREALGGTRSYQTILTPVRNKWGRIHRIAGISRDVTALKEAQAALEASEERLALALEGTQQGLWDWDVAHATIYRSPRWFEMLGLEPGAVGPTFEAGLERVHPDDRDGLEQALRLHVDGHLPRMQAEYRVLSGTGEWIWIFDACKVVSWTEDGHPARITGLTTDISERRRAEESLRALVGGVVHEMRNPAFGIGVNLDALEATFGSEERYAPFVAALRESCDRILSLMNDLRDYGEPRTLRAEPCRVRTLVEQAAASCAALASQRGCRIVIRFEDDDLVLPLHAFRIHQVFRNLIENSLYHAPAGSEVSVSCGVEQRQRHAWAVLRVADQGGGFDAEALVRAFEPFFTRRSGGTGLGLSIVKRVVEEHGGTVTAANGVPSGAVVTMSLPIARSSMPGRRRA